MRYSHRFLKGRAVKRVKSYNRLFGTKERYKKSKR